MKSYTHRLTIMACTSMIVLASINPAGAALITIDTSTDWRATDTFEAGFTNFLFDDSNWRNAHAAYSGNAAATGAGILWDHPNPLITDPSDHSLPNEAWFRQTFWLDNAVQSATMDYLVNDEIDIYINDLLVINDRSNGSTVELGIDISSFLSDGNNVIAVYAFDGGIVPFERGAAYFSIGLDIETVNSVSTPANLAVLILGLLGLTAAQRQLKRS